MTALYRKRRIINGFNLTVSMFTVLFGLFWLAWILWTLIHAGIGAIDIALFTKMTPPPGSDGGLLNAILGSLIMSVLATLIGTPIGVLAGTYLAEFGQHGWLGATTRFINDILLQRAVDRDRSVHLCRLCRADRALFRLGGNVRAVAAGDSRGAQDHRKHAASWCRTACAKPRPRSAHRSGRVVTLVTWRAGRAGIITGILLAVARISGETAPLAVHGAQQSVLVREHECADGQPAGRHLPVCHEPVCGLAAPRLGRRAADHVHGAGPQHSGAGAVPRKKIRWADKNPKRHEHYRARCQPFPKISMRS